MASSSRTRRLLIDIAGVSLIIIAPLLGWLPGPGGIPLLLAGLALLSINHEWARRWRQSLEKHGLQLSRKLFPDHGVAQFFYDALSVVAFIAAVYVFNHFDKNLIKSLAIVIFFTSLAIFCLNRQRLERLTNRIKNGRSKA